MSNEGCLPSPNEGNESLWSWLLEQNGKGGKGNFPEATATDSSPYLFLHFQKTTEMVLQSGFITFYYSKLILMEDFIFEGSYTYWIANINEKWKLHLDMQVSWNCAGKSTLILQFPNLTACKGGVHSFQLLYSQSQWSSKILQCKTLIFI